MSINASSRPITQKRWMCVKSQQSEHGDNLELELVALMGDPLRQRMQAQEQEPNCKNGDPQDHGRCH
jgi:hypothetical protein